MRNWACLLALGIVVVLAPPPAAGATIRVDVEGRPIRARDVGRYHCHDFDYPQIHCFRTSRTLERAVAPRLAPRSKPGAALGEPLGTTALSYVRVYEHSYFGGSSAYFSVNYTDLRTIGWNDRISSFSGLNGSAGQFFTDIWYAASAYQFCCNQSVAQLNSWNDRFSSVKAII